MTTNEPPNQLEWSIRARSGVDSGQWYWGISKQRIVCAIYIKPINICVQCMGCRHDYNTVKPMMTDHPMGPQKVILYDR